MNKSFGNTAHKKRHYSYSGVFYGVYYQTRPKYVMTVSQCKW